MNGLRRIFYITAIIILAGSVMAKSTKASLLHEMSQAGSRHFTNDSMLEWAYANIKLRVGGEVIPFSLEGHEPLRELYTLDHHPHVVVRKGAQLGVSTYDVIRSMFLSARHAMRIGYYFPTDEDVDDFVTSRVNPMIEDSEHLHALIKGSRTDNTSVKIIGKSVMFFRGVFTKRKVKTIDLDYVVKDEVDEANQENLKFAEDRLLHSKFGYISELSQPSIDDYGIDRSFKMGDSRYWGVRCTCGHWNFPDKSWPDCLMTRGSATYVGCVRCTKRLNLNSGQWVAEHPSRTDEIRSYQLSHLIFPFVKAEKIKKKDEEAVRTIDKKNFSISILGKTYSNKKTNPITDAVLHAAQRDYGFSHEAKFSYFGMDVGDKCHLVFGHPYNGKIRIHYVTDMDSDDEAGIIRLMKRMGVYYGVIDAMPYKTLAKNIARKFEGRVYINYYKGDTLKEGEEGQGEKAVPKVTIDRTESLDDTTEAVVKQRIELPDPKRLNDDDTLVYEQFKAQVKMLIKEGIEKDGAIIYRYKKLVPNHYGMALNYMRIAAELASMNLISDVDPIGVQV
jgi:hypothetical protein